jgi:hypothetical protein
VTINGRTVVAPIYDWQLIPIAKFADSPYFSCFTMFGQSFEPLGPFEDRPFNYHPDFENTLMGLRLFQLDSLILTKDSTDLVKDGETYILGAGESAPDLSANQRGWEEFERFQEKDDVLWDFHSYVIGDYRRDITFNVNDGKLSITGEPYVYFWTLDDDSYNEFENGEAIERARRSIGRAVRGNKVWLVNQILIEAQKRDGFIGETRVLQDVLSPESEDLLSADPQSRGTRLRQMSPASLLDLLVELRAFNSLPWTKELRQLSEVVSRESAMLRAINPAVWDAGVNLVRYAAFFRYCKKKSPAQWQQFMREIRAAPAPQRVMTPTGWEN